MICNKIRYAFHLSRQSYILDTTDLEVCVLRIILEAPILNYTKTSLMCLFVTDVKYGSKEIEVLNILYVLNLVLLQMCSCQFWLWQSISLCLNNLIKSSGFCTLDSLIQTQSQICAKFATPVIPSRTGHCYVLITSYCRPFVEAWWCHCLHFQ